MWNKSHTHSLREKCTYLELSWPAFSRIWTEYGDLLSKSPYSHRMQENTDQKNSKYGHISHSDYLWYHCYLGYHLKIIILCIWKISLTNNLKIQNSSFNFRRLIAKKNGSSSQKCLIHTRIFWIALEQWMENTLRKTCPYFCCSGWGKIRTRKTPNTDTFHAVTCSNEISIWFRILLFQL